MKRYIDRVRKAGTAMAVYGARLGMAVAALELRDWAILLGLALAWFGLRDAWRPLGNIGVGAFLLWFTTIRKSA